MENKTVLQVNNITKRFPGVLALDNVSLSLFEGEILSICGENGAGKSTLMKILSGEYEYKSYSGDIILDGHRIKIHSNADAEKYGIAMIYQEISVELDLSVAENIMLGMLPKKKTGLIDWKKARKTAAEAIKRLQVQIDVNTKIRELNASYQQLVCIARALVRNPKILILDEPTAALTESETEHLMNVLNDLKYSGISCVYISHKLDEVFRISDRIVCMRDGCLISTYEKKEIDPNKVIEDIVGRKIDEVYPSMKGRVIGDEVLKIENFTVPHPSGSKNIVNNISFSVRKGEVLGLVGLVGSGRSELLRAVYGALPKKTGDVFIDGKKCFISTPTEAIENGIGFLTEERKKDGVVGTMNIGENMTLSILKKISKRGFIKHKSEHENILKYFTALKIKAFSKKENILHLSGGNQQKVVLAKSLMTDMKVLFLDEPTRGVDIGAKAEIYRIIEDLSRKGLSIVMISSEHPELIAMCDRFVIIGNGNKIGEVMSGDIDEGKMIRMASCI